jgi:hypothetical protein
VSNQFSSDSEAQRAHFAIVRHDFVHRHLMRPQAIGVCVARFTEVAGVRPVARMGAHVPFEAQLVVDCDATQGARLGIIVDLFVHHEDVTAQGALHLKGGAALGANGRSFIQMGAHVFANGAFHHETPLAEVAFVLPRQVREPVLPQAAFVHAHPAAYLHHGKYECVQNQIRKKKSILIGHL